MIIKNFLNDEKGSAITEFVIGLPIFLMIFSGMGSLYSIGRANLASMGSANTQLWASAQDSLKTSVAVSPAATILSIGTTKSLIANGSQMAGIYVDSWTKLKPAQLIPGSTSVTPVWSVPNIHSKFREKSPAKHLLDDMYSLRKSGTGFAGIVNGLVAATGSGLGLAAGIRYGGVEGTSKEYDISTGFGTYKVNPGYLTLPLNTAATHRLAAIALIRLEHMTDKATDESILNFTYSPDTDGAPNWGTAGSSTPPPAGSCGAQKQTHATCMGDAMMAMKAEWEACGECKKKRPSKYLATKQCEGVEPDSSCGEAATSPITIDANTCEAFGLPPNCNDQLKE